MIRFELFFVLVLAAAGACGGGSSGPSAETRDGGTPTATDAEFQSAAENAANSVLIKMADLPMGWQLVTFGTADRRGTLELPTRCDVLNDDGFPQAAINKHEFGYEGPKKERLSPAVAVFRTQAEATSSFDRYAGAIDDCRVELVTALKKSIESSGFTNIDLAIKDIPRGLSTDELKDYRVSLHFTNGTTEINGQYELVVMRVGRMLGGASYFTLDAANALFDSLTKTLAGRMGRFAPGLPE